MYLIRLPQAICDTDPGGQGEAERETDMSRDMSRDMLHDSDGPPVKRPCRPGMPGEREREGERERQRETERLY